MPLVQISWEIWQRLLFMRYFVSPRPCIASPALLEKWLSSSTFVLLDTRKSLKPLRRREIISDLSNVVKKILHKISCHRLFKEKIAVFKCELWNDWSLIESKSIDKRFLSLYWPLKTWQLLNTWSKAFLNELLSSKLKIESCTVDKNCCDAWIVQLHVTDWWKACF